MANGEIWEDEVTTGCGSIQIGHAGHWHASENRYRRVVGALRYSAMGDIPCRLKCGEEEEVGIVGKGNVLLGFAFKYAKLHHRRRVNWAAVCGSWTTLARSKI